MTTDIADGGAGAVIAGQRVELLDRARVYACGITPYDVTHLGHAATFVWIDTLGRVLRLLGVQPEVCRNVTDVDDVLDVAAGRAGAAYDEFAAIQQFGFDRDMAAIGVRSPDHEPRAHRYVTHVIRLAAGLLEAGTGYQRAGGVYFRGAGVAGRAGLDRDAALALSGEFGGRPDDPAKDDPLYYYRPWKTILVRTVADGGESFYVRGDHRVTVPHLRQAALQAEGAAG